MKRALVIVLFAACSLLTYGQDSVFTISGYVKDAATGEELIGATLYIDELGTGTVTNLYGFYSISLPAAEYTFNFRYIGYTLSSQRIDLTQNKTFNIELGSDEKILEEVLVTARKEDQNISNIEMSVEKINIQTVKKMPQLLGEVDLIRSIKLLPGVTSVGEGATGFNVRGGDIDQNLVLLDEAPVYNSSHLFGFFAVFNTDAIKDAKLYKGGIPAKYGGRLSSVLDVRQNEGNKKRFSGRGGLGLLSSRLTLEGPFKKDKSS
ncbi:MAG: TonB-dependent receptor [Bacteroidetes bacterium]|nr:TonB-dependent receptor [Bacteroidota bacterium]